MPIKGLSEKRQLPRLGKIHLGVRDETKGYPKKTDYFVCPPEVQAVFGEQPKALRILIPVEDEEKFASQYYRCYSKTRGLICKGDGERADRLIDAKTGALADAGSKDVVWKEIECKGKDCPDYRLKCKPIMNLQFLLPEVPGMGIWQVDTGSVNSIKQINSAIELVRALCGRIAMIPLLLTLEPKEAINPDTNKKQTIYCLNLRTNGKMGDMALAAGKSNVELLNGMLALPVGDDERPDCAPEFEPDPVDVPPDNRPIDEIIDDLWGPGCEAEKPLGTEEKPLTPGSNTWILSKMAELSISEQGMLEYINQTLHLPIEKTVKDTLEKLTEKQQIKEAHRITIAKTINLKEKQHKQP